MTTHLDVSGLAPGDEQPRCTDPPELRQLAERRRNQATLLKLQAAGLEREADQFEHEALSGRWPTPPLTSATRWRTRLQGFKTAEKGARAANRKAEDALSDSEAHRDQRVAEAAQADSGTDRDAQDDAAARVARAQKRVREAKTATTAGTAKHAEADAPLKAHNQNLLEAQSAVDSALQAAGNPGIAPRKSFTPGITGLSEMDEDARDALRAAGLLAYAASSGSGQAPAGKSGLGTTRSGFAEQDPSKFRLVRSGRGTVAIPPRWDGTPAR